jgi:hypothetical protein
MKNKTLIIGNLYQRRKDMPCPSWDLTVQPAKSFENGWELDQILMYLGENLFFNLTLNVKVQLNNFIDDVNFLKDYRAPNKRLK